MLCLLAVIQTPPSPPPPPPPPLLPHPPQHVSPYCDNDGCVLVEPDSWLLQVLQDEVSQTDLHASRNQKQDTQEDDQLWRHRTP